MAYLNTQFETSMMIVGGECPIASEPDVDVIARTAVTIPIIDLDEVLDWMIRPKLSEEFNYHTALAKGESLILYTRSASAMIKGLKKIQDLCDDARVFSAHDACLGLAHGAFELSGYTKSKVGAGIAITGHNVKQFFVRSFIKGVGGIANATFKNRKANAGDDWDKMTVDLERKKWFKKFRSFIGNSFDRYQSFDQIDSTMNPFSKGFIVVIAHSSSLPSRPSTGGAWRTISHKLKFSEIANILQNMKAEKGSVYKH